jgi:hypothetical protein
MRVQDIGGRVMTLGDAADYSHLAGESKEIVRSPVELRCQNNLIQRRIMKWDE